MGCLQASNTSNDQVNLVPTTTPPVVDEKVRPVVVNDTKTDAPTNAPTAKSEMKREPTKVQTASKLPQVETDSDFIERYLRELNEFRSNPAKYAEKVEYNMQYIIEDKSAKSGKVYSNKGLAKVALQQGEQAFRQAIDLLKTLQPLSRLVQNDSLKIPFNADPAKWTDYKGLGVVVENEVKAASKFNELTFHWDQGHSSPEIAVLLQVVDDSVFKLKRRTNLITCNNIGVNFKKVVDPTTNKTTICHYYCFAK